MRLNPKTIFRGARQLAEYLGVSPNAVHVLVNRGLLPVRRQGRTLVFVKGEIDQFFASLPGVSVREALRATTEHPPPPRRPREDRRGATEHNGNSRAGQEPGDEQEER